MADVDSQVIYSYNPGDPQGSGAFQEELKNQQLNEALASGTVDNITMKTGYGGTGPYSVAIQKDLGQFITLPDVTTEINNTNTYNFGNYTSTKKLYVKSSANYATQKAVPVINTQLSIGEIAIDNFDASLYLLGASGTQVKKVDAGSVNGFVVETNVTTAGYVDRNTVIALINSAFVYDSVTNSLTIKTI